MDGLIEWGYGVLNALQGARTPLGDILFQALSLTGEEEFYLLLVPLLYWFVDKRLATRFSVLFLLSVYLNIWAKVLLAQPRPSAERVLLLERSETVGGGLPSGHAQNAMASWGYLATVVRARPVRWAFGALIAGIGLSRLYLGVHFPHDVLAGWLLGALLLAIFVTLAPRVALRLDSQSLAARMLWGGGGAAVLALLFHAEAALEAMATLCGLGIGVPLEREGVRFRTRVRGAREWGGRLLVGLALLLLLWRGLKPPLAALGLAGDFLRYTLVGIWVSVGAPWLFVRLGLAEQLPLSALPEGAS